MPGLTNEQADAVSAITRAAHGGPHVLVPAVPGSGKSHLLRAAAWELPASVRAAYVAFNRHNVDQLHGHLPAHVPARTFHALGEGLARRHLAARGLTFTHDERKALHLYADLFARTVPEADRAQVTHAASVLRHLHDALTLRNLPITPEQVQHLQRDTGLLVEAPVREAFAHHRGRDLGDPALLASILAWGRRQADALADHGTLDYTDRLTYPVRHGLGRGRYDVLLVDEAQDLNAAQQRLCTHLARRLALVGDPFQSIFGFAHAAPGGLHAFAATLNPVPLVCPLTLSFRLPQIVAKLARAWSPTVQALPDAPEGEIVDLQEAELDTFLRPGDLVVCRTNAPLITLAFRLRRAGQPVRVRGRDLGAQLVAPIRTLVGEDDLLSLHKVAGLIRSLSRRADEEVGKGVRSEASREDLADLLECLRVVAKESAKGGTTTLQRIRAQVDALQSGAAGGIELSSIHRAKGDDARRVVVLRPHLLPLRSGDPREEENIQFVAVTRAAHTLVFAHATGKPCPEWVTSAREREDAPLPVQEAERPFVERASELFHAGNGAQATRTLAEGVVASWGHRRS